MGKDQQGYEDEDAMEQNMEVHEHNGILLRNKEKH
jgi:hypothetical protein